MKKQMQKGFTLIELMIVVAIIGILASIALPAYKTYIIKSKIGGPVMTQIGGIKSNLFETYTTTGKMPAAADITAYEGLLDSHDNIKVAAGDFVRNSDDKATLKIQLENVGSSVEAATDFIEFVFDGNAPTHGFTCNGAVTTVQDKYLPAKCR